MKTTITDGVRDLGMRTNLNLILYFAAVMGFSTAKTKEPQRVRASATRLRRADELAQHVSERRCHAVEFLKRPVPRRTEASNRRQPRTPDGCRLQYRRAYSESKRAALRAGVDVRNPAPFAWRCRGGQHIRGQKRNTPLFRECRERKHLHAGTGRRFRCGS